MIKTLAEVILSYKTGTITATTSIIVAWLAEKLQWIDANLTKLGVIAGLVLTLVMIVSHVCNTIRQNKLNRVEIDSAKLNDKKKEIEIKELELKVKLLELELDNKKDDQSP
jgi:hypothetical protein